MKKTALIILAALMATFARVGGNSVFASDINVKNDLVVWFKPGTIKGYPAKKGYEPVEMNDLDSKGIYIPEDLKSCLCNLGVTKIKKVFETFKAKDTTGISLTGERYKVPDLSQVFLLSLQEGKSINNIKDTLEQDKRFVLVEIPSFGELFATVNDPDTGLQWGLNNRIITTQGVVGYPLPDHPADIGAYNAWDMNRGDLAIKIGVLDNGVHYSYADLGGPSYPNVKVAGGWDWIDNDNDPDWSYNPWAVLHYHGSVIAGIAASLTNNGIQGAGIAGGLNHWESDKGCQIIALRITEIDGKPDRVKAAAAIEEAARPTGYGCHILNASWGGPEYMEIEHAAVAAAHAYGATFVSARGNHCGIDPRYPSCLNDDWVICVNGTSFIRPPFSAEKGGETGWGDKLDIIAPGQNIKILDKYVGKGTSSYAAAFVSGIVGLIRSDAYQRGINLHVDDVEGIVKAAADPNVFDEYTIHPEYYGAGFAKADRALQLMRDPYCMIHSLSGIGGTTISTAPVWMNFYNTVGVPLPYLSTSAMRHEVRKTIQFPRFFSSQPYVWGRGVNASTGYSDDVNNYQLGYCKVVPGSITNTNAELQSFVYYAYGSGYTGWLPFTPDHVNFAYTVIGVPQPPHMTSASLQQPSAKGPGNSYNLHLSWDYAYGCPTLLKYEVQKQEPLGSGVWVNFITNISPNAMGWTVGPMGIYNDFALRMRAVHSDGFVTPWSNEWVIHAPVPGDPIVATVQSPEATAYSNGRKIVIDDAGALHVTFTSGGAVYYTKSTDQGETWTPGEAVAMGQNPALALKADGTPQLYWNEGSNVYTSERAGGIWGEAQLVYSGSPGEDISYLSFVADPQSGKTYSGWVGTVGGSSQVLVAERTPGNPIQPAPERIDFGEVAFKSPCLALKRDGTLLNAWSKDGVVRFREGDGSIMELSQPGRHCIHPMVESYGDRVTVVWQEALDYARAKGLEPGRHKIVSRIRDEYGWGEEKVIALSDAGDYQYPVAAAAGQYLYAGHHGDGDYDIHYLGDYADGWETHTRNISINSEGQSGYPCAAFSNRWPEHALYILWTEAFPDSAKGILDPPLVKDYLDVIQPVPLLEVYPRTEQASKYCTQRAGGLCYGAGAYRTVDYHPTELKYRFAGLNKNNRYKLKAVFYRSNSGGQADPSGDWLLQPRCDQVSFGTVRLPDTTVVTMEREIPRQCLNDGAVDITIRRIKGDYAVCAALEVIEYTTGGKSDGGGVQSAESEPMPAAYRYELMACAPNPFKQITTINYQTAKPGRVSLKVYNTLGQLVRTLEDGERPAGSHSVRWDGRDGNGHQVSNGVYLYRLEAGDFGKTRKMTLVR